MTELSKTFDPAEIEARWYAHWEANGLFRPDRPGAEPWTIVNPPPNVTGSLHIGHALDNTLQDILTRHARLKGKDARWVVGTDHAGIATQMVVERNLASQGVKRTDMTREAFIEHVQEWKAQSGGAITRQLRRLGCSMDWANERFTMDEGLTKATLKVFVDLYNEGLLYRDKRLVNWDPGLGTAISDLEVETREVQGKFWHLSYPLEDPGSESGAGASGAISVATTRPETMLADMAVAVNPADDRYTALIGKNVRLPITGRLVPIIADEHADPELGSGAVKITPGHDFNDFEVGKRAGIEPRDMLNMLDAKAHVTQTSDELIPEELIGIDRFEARARVVAMLEEAGALERVEDRAIQTPYGDRSGEVIEPWLTDQWYVDAATLAKPAIEAVRDGRIRIVPKTWEKTFFNWMENIQPWCVSRQLWWGHRIPAWYGYAFEVVDDKKANFSGAQTFVAETEEEARKQAEQYVASLASRASLFEGCEVEVVDSEDLTEENAVMMDRGNYPIWQDPDVLDTWFSSALWPFATLGWPEDHSSPSLLGEGDQPQAGGGAAGVAGGGPSGVASPSASLRAPPPALLVPLPETSSGRNLGGRYPNDVLISGFDILFFWDARMMMQGLHFMGDVPFRTLYLHGLVRAADGQKMSKSKGNTVDPLGLIDRYGADALRFFMAAMESQGRDIKMDEKRVEGYRNFATKLWNAARFCQANGIGGSTTLEPPPATLAVNKWIVGECVKAIQAVDLALAELRFDAAANAIYQFVWSRFCDWYVELVKGAIDDETKAVAGWVLDQILVVLHPFMPFITEELWHALADRDGHDLIVAKWPMADARAIDPEAAAEVSWLIDLVGEIRRVRNDVNVPPSARTELWIEAPQEADGLKIATIIPETTIRRLQKFAQAIHRLARCSVVQVLNTGQAFDLATLAKIDRTSHHADVNGAASLVVEGDSYLIPLKDIIDIPAERARLAKSIAAAEKERDALATRLGNASFVERAKPEAVEKARADHADKAAEAERLAAALGRLG